MIVFQTRKIRKRSFSSRSIFEGKKQKQFYVTTSIMSKILTTPPMVMGRAFLRGVKFWDLVGLVTSWVRQLAPQGLEIGEKLL